MKILGIIPARSGSKRLPGKNTMDFCGKPMIEWTIDAAVGSMIDDIVVTTDDPKVVAIAANKDVHIHLRDKYLCRDDTTTPPVLRDVVDKYTGYDYAVLLQATSPLRQSQHIDGALECLRSEYDSVVAVRVAEFKQAWLRTIEEDVLYKVPMTKSQLYVMNGSIVIFKPEVFTEWMWGKNTAPYIMNRERSIDIDTRLDFDIAEMMYAKS